MTVRPIEDVEATAAAKGSESGLITTEMVEAACVAAYGADWRAWNASGWPAMQNALCAALPGREDVSDFNGGLPENASVAEREAFAQRDPA